MITTDTTGSRGRIEKLVLGSPEVPLAWPLLIWVGVASAMSIAIAFLLGATNLALYVVVPCILAGVVAGTSRLGGELGRAVAFAVTLSLLQGLSAAVANMPVGAAVALGVVTFLATAMTAVPHWSTAGALMAMGYFLAAVYGYVVRVSGTTPWTEAALLGLAGALLGAATVSGVRRWSARHAGSEISKHSGVPAPAAAPTLSESAYKLFDFLDPDVQFALIRGVLSGLGMWAFLYSGAGRNAAWIFLTAFMTLQPAVTKTLEMGVLRVAGTACGVLAFGLLVTVLPPKVAGLVALGGLVVGLLYIRRSTIVMNLGMTLFIIGIFGSTRGEYIPWALARLADVAIGGTIAVLAGFVILPGLHAAGRLGGPKGRREGSAAASGGMGIGGATAGGPADDATAMPPIASADGEELGDLGGDLPG